MGPGVGERSAHSGVPARRSGICGTDCCIIDFAVRSGSIITWQLTWASELSAWVDVGLNPTFFCTVLGVGLNPTPCHHRSWIPFVRPACHPCIHSLLHSFIRSFMHACIHAFMHWFIHAFTPSCMHFMHSLIPSFMHLFMHLFMHVFMRACIHEYQYTPQCG